MTRFQTIGAACLAVALAASSPALARAGHGGGGFHASGAHFVGGAVRGGGGYRGGRGGFGPGIAAGLIAGAVIGGGYYGAAMARATMAIHMPTMPRRPTTTGRGYGGYDNGYGARNGFVCQPGHRFQGRRRPSASLSVSCDFCEKGGRIRPPFLLLFSTCHLQSSYAGLTRVSIVRTCGHSPKACQSKQMGDCGSSPSNKTNVCSSARSISIRQLTKALSAAERMLSLGCLAQYCDKALVFSVKSSGSKTDEFFLWPKIAAQPEQERASIGRMVFSQNCSQVMAEKSTGCNFSAGCANASVNEHINNAKHAAVTDFMTSSFPGFPNILTDASLRSRATNFLFNQAVHF